MGSTEYSAECMYRMRPLSLFEPSCMGNLICIPIWVLDDINIKDVIGENEGIFVMVVAIFMDIAKSVAAN